ncbi:hypothetical protein ACFWCB_05035 [Streptomyces sp. NPDC060048]|uniref:hypothetical protein n=1 Tax=unclassified Streptomyces TaxID=2593676 RepID=UPI0036B559E3
MALVAPQYRLRTQSRVPALARVRTAPRTAAVLTGAGLALVPWMLVLAKTLPQSAEVSNWATAWIGLDVMLAAGLTGTGLLLRRQDSRVVAVAAATAALLVADAWFDVTTSAGGEQTLALLLAAGAELPLTVVCAAVAWRRW